VAGAILLAGACGAGAATTTGAVTLKWYTAPQKGGSFDQAAQDCSAASNGRYRVRIEPLPSGATQQREQLVRRLAAHDHDIDLISMDVIWTAEFGEAGWVTPWPDADAAQLSQGVFPTVLATGRYRNRMYAAPLNTNTQLLWYRKDLVPNPPATWDEMLHMARALPAGRNKVQVQGARYEGYTVWFNSMLASAGGSILDPGGKVSLATAPTETALRLMHDLASSSAADPSLSNYQEDESRLAFQSGSSAFMVNYPFVYTSVKKDAPDLFKNLGVALWPAVTPGQPARVTLGGFNMGVATHGRHRSLAFEAARCIVSPPNQVLFGTKDGLPPVTEALYNDPRVRAAYPFADLMLESIRNGAARPASPAYNDISLAVQRTIHPPSSISPRSDVGKLRARVDDAINSRGLL
jgi:multiple sugar transport system substrate-binding protein